MKSSNSEEKLPQILRDLKEKGDGFRIPEGYFDQFEESVFTRLRADGDIKAPHVQLKKRPGVWAVLVRPKAIMAYAAVLVLLLAAFWFIRQPEAVNITAPVAAVDLTEEEIEAYVMENIQEFETDQLAALTPEVEPAPAVSNPAHESAPVQEDVHPDDLEEVLDEMTDEELEEIL